MFWSPGDVYVVSLFYRYVDLSSADLTSLIANISTKASNHQLKGRCLVSMEGLNGTLAGKEHDVYVFGRELAALHEGFSSIDFKYSFGRGDTLPFDTLSVRYSKELISCGTRVGSSINDQISFDDTYGGLNGTGVHLEPQEFHDELVLIAST
jgi:predicted sulfurtransferase